MKRMIIAVVVILVLLICVTLLIEVPSVVKPPKMLTYTSEELGFSIEYPEDWEWEVIEGPLETWVFFRSEDPEEKNMCIAVMVKEDLPKEMDLEEFVETTIKEESQFYHKIKEYHTIINGKDAIVIIHEGSGYIWGAGTEVKWKEKVVHIMDDTTGYKLTCGASPPKVYIKADKKYFDVIAQSFKCLPKLPTSTSTPTPPLSTP